MSRVCTNCNVEKHEKDFRAKGRGLSKVCMACEDGTAEVAEDADKAATVIEIEPSMGARLKIGPNSIELEQDRKGEDGELYTHTVTLMPHEARQVIDQVASWVEKAA